jgi:proline iminopeptidase
LRRFFRTWVLIPVICACTVLPRPDAAEAQRSAQGMFSLDDARIFYEVVGTGAPIIVVHGGPGLDHNYLRPGLDVLANQNSLVYYDQRGTGRSTADLTAGAINLDAFVGDIEQLRLTLGYDQVTVLAHSFGALIGLEYAIQFPDNLRALILMNPVEPGQRFQDQTAERQRSRSRAEDRTEMADLTASEAFQARDPATLGQVYRVAFRQVLRDRDKIDELNLDLAGATARNGQDVAALLGVSLAPPIDWWDRLAGVRTPTLVLHGRHDAPPLDMSRELAEALPVGSFESLNTGHFPYLEDREALQQAIAGFFATLR